jgi:hypothetical protein
MTYLENNGRRPRSGLMNDGTFNGFGFDPFNALPVAEVHGVHKIIEYRMCLPCY